MDKILNLSKFGSNTMLSKFFINGCEKSICNYAANSATNLISGNKFDFNLLKNSMMDGFISSGTNIT
jgi:hypothetical protein